ncbi:hypothetical protein SLE2022_302750 [Rubroshorea leprosula]
MVLFPASLILGITISLLRVACCAGSNNSSTTCGVGYFSMKVQYPFGFSSGDPIQLNCTDTVRIGDFRVDTVTADGILVYLPAKCNRPILSVYSLFGDNYAPSWRNSMLLQNCNDSGSVCEMKPRLLDHGCGGGGDNITCFPKHDNNSGHILTKQQLNATKCGFLYSSIAADYKNASVGSLEKVKLEWWIEGNCSSICHKNATCTNVELGYGKLGVRCACKEGFVGDGFLDSLGCRRAPICSATRYVSGKCGGTIRVGILVGGLIAGALSMAGLVLICYFIRRCSNSSSKQMRAKRLLCEAAGNSSVPFYPYKEMERATNCFSEKQRLGTGAYGTVYAGKLQNDDWVAIKRFRYRDPDSIDQVMNEIKLLSSVSHPNLVRLLGCCIEEGEPILLYEFMPNGTLSQHLQRERGRVLPWTIRLTIAAETAKAIAYLHSVMNPPIYHRDIKSSNILLDFDFKSKVADFGLSRLGNGMTDSHISTAPQGTPGYLDPQYHQYFHLSDKSDVYSFGVVLVEIITAMKVVDFSRPHSDVNLAALAIDRIGRGCVDEIIDPCLDPHKDAWTLSSIHSVAELAFRCLAFHRDMRPTMMEVAEELEQLRLSSWVQNMYMASPITSSCSSDDESEKSCMTVKSARRGSRKLIFPPRGSEKSCLTSFDEVKDSSPVSVQDPWLSAHSSPSASSLLGKVIQ